MVQAGVDRRLAAILAADVVGYSRLMAVDEEGTLARLQALRAERIDPTVAQHHGRIVKLMGDGALVEFASVVDAVRCAVDVQRGMAGHEAELPEDQRIRLRIGVNLGDVILEGDDIYGDGVNIAARLEQIASPGGICLSEDAYRQVRGKLEMPVVDAGAQNLKNISNRVRVYRIEPSGAAATAAGPSPPAESRRRWSVRTVAGAATTVAVALAAVTWFALLRDRPDVSRSAQPATPTAVSAMPIIAVLPFANQTGDDSQDYFVDGVTEEVINALGRFNTLRVIGSNAVQRYKKHPPTQEEIASELGANYLGTRCGALPTT